MKVPPHVAIDNVIVQYNGRFIPEHFTLDPRSP